MQNFGPKLIIDPTMRAQHIRPKPTGKFKWKLQFAKSMEGLISDVLRLVRLFFRNQKYGDD